jgi:hypothetical protein
MRQGSSTPCTIVGEVNQPFATAPAAAGQLRVRDDTITARRPLGSRRAASTRDVA